MGKLLDAKQISYRDLAGAVLRAYDPRVQEAARTLLASWLGKPWTMHYGAQVIEGSYYLEDNEHDNLVESSMYVGAAIGFAFAVIFLIFFGIIPWIFLQVAMGNLTAVAITTPAVLLLIGWLIREFYLRIKVPYKNYRAFEAGRKGEEKVVDRLRNALDNRWTIFRNLHLPGHNDDIDIVLVGPAGVWALEVKSTRTNTRVQGKRWEMQVQKGWVSSRENPSDQVTKDARQLNDFLKRQGIVRWVERAVVLTGYQPITNFTDSEIPIWLLPTLEENVGVLTTRMPPTQKEIEQINVLLKELSKRQITLEDAKYGREISMGPEV